MRVTRIRKLDLTAKILEIEQANSPEYRTELQDLARQIRQHIRDDVTDAEYSLFIRAAGDLLMNVMGDGSV